MGRPHRRYGEPGLRRLRLFEARLGCSRVGGDLARPARRKIGNRAPVIIPEGEYVYEIREQGHLTAIETAHLNGAKLTGIRRSTDASGNRHEVEADLDEEGLVRAI